MNSDNSAIIDSWTDTHRVLLVFAAAILTLAGAFTLAPRAPSTPKPVAFAEEKATVLKALEERKALADSARECAGRATARDALLDCLDAEYAGRISLDERLAPTKSRPEAEAALVPWLP